MHPLIDILVDLEAAGATGADIMRIFSLTDVVDGTAQRVADTMMSGLRGAWRELVSALEELALALASAGLADWPPPPRGRESMAIRCARRNCPPPLARARGRLLLDRHHPSAAPPSAPPWSPTGASCSARQREGDDWRLIALVARHPPGSRRRGEPGVQLGHRLTGLNPVRS